MNPIPLPFCEIHERGFPSKYGLTSSPWIWAEIGKLSCPRGEYS